MRVAARFPCGHEACKCYVRCSHGLRELRNRRFVLRELARQYAVLLNVGVLRLWHGRVCKEAQPCVCSHALRQSSHPQADTALAGHVHVREGLGHLNEQQLGRALLVKEGVEQLGLDARLGVAKKLLAVFECICHLARVFVPCPSDVVSRVVQYPPEPVLIVSVPEHDQRVPSGREEGAVKPCLSLVVVVGAAV